MNIIPTRKIIGLQFLILCIVTPQKTGALIFGALSIIYLVGSYIEKP